MRDEQNVVLHPAYGPAEIFQRLGEAPPGQPRRALIDSLCAGDEDLRAHMLEMVESLEDEERTGAADPAREPPMLRPGLVLGKRYLLERPLGRGGSAVVWQARDSTMRRTVALKIFPRTITPELWARLVEEARAAADVESDHVVRVHGVSDQSMEALFIDLQLCREFVKGEQIVARSLDQHTRDSEVAPHSPREVASWIEQAACGAQAAHDRGVYNGDLKPANILLLLKARTVKVTDFGGAVRQAIAEPEDGESVTLVTPDGKFVGTPAYMAPERAAGIPNSAATVAERDGSSRADVYGLGATAYELLSGEPPYRPRAGARSATQDILEQVQSGPPEPLRSSSARFKRIPRRLRQIVVKAMARRPEERYPTPGALADDLERWRSHHLTSVDMGLRRRALAFVLPVRRRPLAALNLVAAISACAIFGLGAYWGADARENREAAEKADRAAQVADKARRVAEVARDQAVQGQKEAQDTLKVISQAKAIAERGQTEAEQALAEAMRKTERAVQHRNAWARAAADAADQRAEAERQRDLEIEKANLADATSASMRQERDAALDVRAKAERERDVQTKVAVTATEQQVAAMRQRDLAIEKANLANAVSEKMRQERDAALAIQVRSERDRDAQAKVAATATERQAAAERQRDAALKKSESMRQERDAALAGRAEAERQRDALIKAAAVAAERQAAVEGERDVAIEKSKLAKAALKVSEQEPTLAKRTTESSGATQGKTALTPQAKSGQGSDGPANQAVTELESTH